MTKTKISIEISPNPTRLPSNPTGRRVVQWEEILAPISEDDLGQARLTIPDPTPGARDRCKNLIVRIKKRLRSLYNTDADLYWTFSALTGPEGIAVYVTYTGHGEALPERYKLSFANRPDLDATRALNYLESTTIND